MTKKQKNLLTRVLVSGALLLIYALAPLKQYPTVRFVLYLVPYLIVGHDILRKAYKGILHRQVFDEHFLMSVATIGAMALGEYTEGVAVMWFYQIGELFQSCAVDRSRRSISELMDIRPDYANIESDGALERVDPDDVEVGSIIVVQPGEKVPIDGVITEGESTLNTAALTGESLPRDVRAGDEIVSGSVNLSGLLKVRTTKAFGESTASKILDLVENAGSRKAKSEQFITKFARVYTPAVCYSALALAVLPPLVRLMLSIPPLWGQWIYRALTFLVISCPCAIVVSIPLSFFGGIGGASNQGILIKGSNFMETLANVKTVVFDKTGTITKGNFAVAGVHHATMPEKQLLEYAALAESHSSHPISQSLRQAYGRELALDRVSDVQEISGHGVVARVDGRQVAAGNRRHMSAQGVDCEDCHSVGTVVHLAVDGA
ncbi:MAG: heavy metal translocating P-type ATPase, partial [Oscillospiraceae bacterium]|nr:heavy metal translocating P-type ATPase [Oscillospiraceae bacterium]